MPILQKMQPLLILLWPSFRAHSTKMITFNEMAAKWDKDREEKPSGRNDILSFLFALHEAKPEFTIEEIFNDSFDAL